MTAVLRDETRERRAREWPWSGDDAGESDPEIVGDGIDAMISCRQESENLAEASGGGAVAREQEQVGAGVDAGDLRELRAGGADRSKNVETLSPPVFDEIGDDAARFEHGDGTTCAGDGAGWRAESEGRAW